MAKVVRSGATVTMDSKDPGSKKNYTVDLSAYLGTDTLATSTPVVLTPDAGITTSGLTNTTTTFSFYVDAGATELTHTIIATWDTTAGITDETIAIKIPVVKAENATL